MVHILIKWSIDKRVIQVVVLFDIIFQLKLNTTRKYAIAILVILSPTESTWIYTPDYVTPDCFLVTTIDVSKPLHISRGP